MKPIRLYSHDQRLDRIDWQLKNASVVRLGGVDSRIQGGFGAKAKAWSRWELPRFVLLLFTDITTIENLFIPYIDCCSLLSNDS